MALPSPRGDLGQPLPSGPQFPYLCQGATISSRGPREIGWDRPRVSSSWGTLPSGHLTHGPVGGCTQSAARAVFPGAWPGLEGAGGQAGRPWPFPTSLGLDCRLRGSLSGPRGLGGALGPAVRPLTPGGGRGQRPQALEQRLGLGCPRRGRRLCPAQLPRLLHPSTQCVPAAPRAAGRPARGWEDVLPGSTWERPVVIPTPRPKHADLGSDSSPLLGVVLGKRRQKAGGQEPSSSDRGLSSAPIFGQGPLPTVGHCPLRVTWNKGSPRGGGTWDSLDMHPFCISASHPIAQPHPWGAQAAHPELALSSSKPSVGLRNARACGEFL